MRSVVGSALLRGQLAFLVLPPLVAMACDGGAELELGAQCQLSSDCRTPLVCRLERCRTECRATRDCPLGSMCIVDSKGLGSCRLPQESECGADEGCPSELACLEGECRQACTGDGQCAEGAVCAPLGEVRACAEPGPPEGDAGVVDGSASDATADASIAEDGGAPGCETGARCGAACCALPEWELGGPDLPAACTTSLALEGDGSPHVVYGAAGENSLMYARLVDGGWASERIIGPREVTVRGTLSIDPAGTPKVAADEASNSTFWFFWDGSAPARTEASSTWPQLPSIAVHTDGQIHVAWEASSSSWLFLAHSADGVEFAEEALVDMEPGGFNVALALDAEGRPHITFHDQNLSYRNPRGPEATVEIVDPDHRGSGQSALQMGSDGEPRVAYRSHGTGIHYAERGGAGAWTVEDVSRGIEVGLWAAMDLDSHDRPHVVYTTTTADLVFAVRIGPDEWLTDTVSNASWGCPSIAVDSAGRPHVVHVTREDTLRYLVGTPVQQ